MSEPEKKIGQWAHDIRPLPGGKKLSAVLVGVCVVVVGGDALTGTYDLSSARGLTEMVVPFLPLVALAIGGAGFAVPTWFLALFGVLLLGAPASVVSWLIFPNLIVVTFCCFLLPWRPALAFTGVTLLLVPALALPGEHATEAVVVLGVAIFLGAMAGLSLNVYRQRQERSAHRIRDLEKHQALVRAEERTRLAYELHDIVAHDVTVMAMQARRVDYVKDPEKLQEILHGIGGTARQTLQDLRSLVALLKEDEKEQRGSHTDKTPSTSEDAEPLGTGAMSGETATAVGFVHDVDAVVDALKRSGFQVSLTVEGQPARIPASMRQALRRTVRELGTNILKHAEPGSQADILLRVEANQATLWASNEVSTAQPIMSSRTGLEAMRARCDAFGGHVTIREEQGRWMTSIVMPLEGLHAKPSGERDKMSLTRLHRDDPGVGTRVD
ncbi:sensor histidine kinase [Nesterenkonia haasae]|uniref:sensor histidine kinase n=1 Tax=Nesterenkonia haasae TaxID=2587813 RepID=UPI001390AE58|nr:histidine kinase [Nesterenkonia haasae]NDK32124.1 two-component sensor histidine kinase [Nesterenkonia haasae]